MWFNYAVGFTPTLSEHAYRDYFSLDLAANAPPSAGGPAPAPPGLAATADITTLDLNYEFKTTQGLFTFHWTINTTSPPNNLCTGGAKSALDPTEVGTGLLHMAVVSNVGNGKTGACKLNTHAVIASRNRCHVCFVAIAVSEWAGLDA